MLSKQINFHRPRPWMHCAQFVGLKGITVYSRQGNVHGGDLSCPGNFCEGAAQDMFCVPEAPPTQDIFTRHCRGNVCVCVCVCEGVCVCMCCIRSTWACFLFVLNYILFCVCVCVYVCVCVCVIRFARPYLVTLELLLLSLPLIKSEWLVLRW